MNMNMDYNKYLYYSNYIIIIEIIKSYKNILNTEEYKDFLNFIIYNNKSINFNSLIEFISHLINLNYDNYEFLFYYINKNYNSFIDTNNFLNNSSFSYIHSKNNVIILNNIIKKMYEYFNLNYGSNINCDFNLSIITPHNLIKNECGKCYYNLYKYFKYYVIDKLSNHFLYLSSKMKYEKALFEYSIILIHKQKYKHAYNCLTSTLDDEKIKNIFEIKYIPSLVILSFFYLNGIIVNKDIAMFNSISQYCIECYIELNKKHNCSHYFNEHWDNALKVSEVLN